MSWGIPGGLKDNSKGIREFHRCTRGTRGPFIVSQGRFREFQELLSDLRGISRGSQRVLEGTMRS